MSNIKLQQCLVKMIKVYFQIILQVFQYWCKNTYYTIELLYPYQVIASVNISVAHRRQ